MLRLRNFFTRLYEGGEAWAVRTRFALLALDVAVITFFVATTFVDHVVWIMVLDVIIGAVFAVDLVARTWLARDRTGYLLQPLTVVDLVVVLSLIVPTLAQNFAFLRVMRSLRLLRSYRVLAELRGRWRFFARHEEVMFSALNLLVFIFTVSALVYVLQHRVNAQIVNYVDALYFTITTLTTTGFGDITLVGSAGRLLAVVIMIVGVTLFIRLVQTMFRPNKVRYECPGCGLVRHDPDAVHCKHCGHLLNIASEGD